MSYNRKYNNSIFSGKIDRKSREKEKYYPISKAIVLKKKTTSKIPIWKINALKQFIQKWRETFHMKIFCTNSHL